MSIYQKLVSALLCGCIVACDTSSTEEESLSDTATSEDTTQDTSSPDLADTSEVSTGALCEVQFENTSTGALYECTLEPTTMIGCDRLAGCLCDAWTAWGISEPPQDRDLCIQSMTVPRGGLTLSDVCALSGAPLGLAKRLPEVVDGPWGSISPPTAATVSFSPLCNEIAAFTLWSEAPNLSWSTGQADQPLPAQGTDFADYPLEPNVLATLDDVASFEGAEARLILTDDGAAHLKSVIEALNAPLLGRFFVFHHNSALNPGFSHFMSGLWVSEVLSSTREGLVIVEEPMVQSGYHVIELESGYPSSGPFTGFWEMEMFTAHIAAQGKLLDAACVSTYGCPVGRTCENERCVAP